jgi:hypothetical protein
MINEVSQGTKDEVLWLFGQILGLETQEDELRRIEAEPGSRAEALFAKGTILQLRHSSLGDYLRHDQFKGTKVAPTMAEARVELAVATMRVLAKGGERTESCRRYLLSNWFEYLRDVNVELCTSGQIVEIIDALFCVFNSRETAMEFAFLRYKAEQMLRRVAQEREVVIQWLARANDIASVDFLPLAKAWAQDVVQYANHLFLPLGENFVRLWYEGINNTHRLISLIRFCYFDVYEPDRDLSFELWNREMMIWFKNQFPEAEEGPLAHLQLAHAYRETEDSEKCKAEFEESLRLANTDAVRLQVQLQAAVSYMKAGDRESANEALLSLRQLDTSRLKSDEELAIAQDAIITLAEAGFRRDAETAALQLYQMARAISKRRDWHTVKWIVHLLSDDYVSIMEVLESWYPNSPDATFWSENEPATTDLKFQSSFERAAFNTGKGLTLVRFYKDAIKHFENSPVASAIKCLYAWCLQHRFGQPKQARKLLEEIFSDDAYLLVSDLDRLYPEHPSNRRVYNHSVRLVTRDEYSRILYQEAAEDTTTIDQRSDILRTMSKLPLLTTR